MKFSALSLAVAGMVLGGVATTSQAATLFFSASATDPGAATPLQGSPTNPSVTLTSLGQTTTLYVWAQVNGNEALNALSYNVVGSNGTTVSGVNSTLLNPSSVSGRTTFFRWASASGGTVGNAGSTALVTNADGLFVAGNFDGIDGYEGIGGTNGGDSARPINGTVVPATANADGTGTTPISNILVGSVTLSAAAQGSVNLFFQTGPATSSFEAGFGGPTIHYGGGDAPVSATVPLSQSSVADATITVLVPEPASLSLLGLGAMGLIARRRRA